MDLEWIADLIGWVSLLALAWWLMRPALLLLLWGWV